MFSIFSLSNLQVEIQKQEVLAWLVKRFTRGLPKEQVMVGWGSASTGHNSCISGRCAFITSLFPQIC